MHHILVSELAAWLRLQVITYNLPQLLKAVALPAEYVKAQPKRLRFAIFTQTGRIIQHAGQTLLRLADIVWQALIDNALRRITIPSPG